MTDQEFTSGGITLEHATRSEYVYYIHSLDTRVGGTQGTEMCTFVREEEEEEENRSPQRNRTTPTSQFTKAKFATRQSTQGTY